MQCCLPIPTIDLIWFQNLEGVIDLYKAAQYAYTHFYKAAPAKPVKEAVVKKKKVVRKK